MIQRDTELPVQPRSQDGAEIASLAPGESAEEQVERRFDFIVRELDEFCALASNSETVDLVEGQKIALGQIVMRSQLIASFLLARKPNSGLRIVRNG